MMEGFTTPTKPKANASIIAAALQAPPRDSGTEQSRPINVSLPWEKSLGQEKLVLIVPNVLSENECNSIIQSCEEKGFEEALLTVGRGRQILATDVRKSGRCIVDDEEASQMIWERLKLKQHVLPEFLTPGSRTIGPSVTSPVWQCTGLNERFRVLKYQPGDYFAPHRDGNFERPWGTNVGKQGDLSYLTLMLYLNTPAKGGGTNFLSLKGHIKPYIPSTGQALVFDHGIRHEGALLEEGVKYAIRTDVMYRRLTPAERAANAHRWNGRPDSLKAEQPKGNQNNK